MKNIFIRRTLIFILAASSPAFAQSQTQTQNQTQTQPTGDVFYRTATAVSMGPLERGPAAVVQGAPYSATITNESVQTLADGNRIVQTSSGTIARDSQGRTRQDAPLPPIGNMSAADVPRIVFIQDPVAQISYTLDLTDKTAQKMPTFSAVVAAPGGAAGPGTAMVTMKMGNDAPPLPPVLPPAVFIQRSLAASDPSQITTENLGSQMMEGVSVNGTRTTRTIPAGQIGNDRPIVIVTEIWTSPDLKTIVSSKRNDPRTGEQTFQLTNIARSDPDPSLFTVPEDFKVVDGPQPILYRPNQ